MMQPRSTFEEFISTPGNERIYEQQRLLVEATELISSVMENTHVKRGELAHRLGRSKAYVTQILRGNQNLTLKTLADVCWALKCRVVMQSLPLAACEPLPAIQCGAPVLARWDLTQRSGNSTVNAATSANDRNGLLAEAA